jgi:hypothetical protein
MSEYIPCGSEWEKELMKTNKKFIIGLLREALNEIHESILLKGEKVLELKSKQDWVNNVPQHLPPDYYDPKRFIWLDAQNNQMVLGEDFMAAEKMKTYPVSVFRLKSCADILREKEVNDGD